MQSEKLYYKQKIALIEHILIMEKLYNNVPIKFCLNGHFFCWDDIKTLVHFMEDNAQIKRIKLTTSKDKYILTSFEDYNNLKEIENHILRELIISTELPELKLEMSIQHIFIISHINEETKEQESKITDFLSIFLNKGNTYKGWYCSGDFFSLQRPDNSPDIENLFV